MIKTGNVFLSFDYNEFHKLEGNREILDNRKNIILQSIKENGWIRNPIVVNEKMQIIDGQGRFEALKELGMPIEFVVAEGATIETCIALNLKQKNWGSSDYIECYSKLGNKNYDYIKDLLKRYDIGQESTLIVASGIHPNFHGINVIKSGEFKVKDPETVEERMMFAKECFEYIDKTNGRRRQWAAVITMVYYCPKIDNQIFLNKLKKYRSFITPCVNIKQVLEVMEKIYNYHSHGETVYFMPEYDKWLKI